MLLSVFCVLKMQYLWLGTTCFHFEKVPGSWHSSLSETIKKWKSTSDLLNFLIIKPTFLNKCIRIVLPQSSSILRHLFQIFKNSCLFIVTFLMVRLRYFWCFILTNISLFRIWKLLLHISIYLMAWNKLKIVIQSHIPMPILPSILNTKSEIGLFEISKTGGRMAAFMSNLSGFRIWWNSQGLLTFMSPVLCN